MGSDFPRKCQQSGRRTQWAMLGARPLIGIVFSTMFSILYGADLPPQTRRSRDPARSAPQRPQGPAASGTIGSETRQHIFEADPSLRVDCDATAAPRACTANAQCASTCLSICPAIELSVCLTVWLPAPCLPFCPAYRVSTYPYPLQCVCPSVCPSIHLHILRRDCTRRSRGCLPSSHDHGAGAVRATYCKTLAPFPVVATIQPHLQMFEATHALHRPQSSRSSSLLCGLPVGGPTK
jgi:hypothetical protein